MAFLSPQAAGEVAAMSRTRSIMVGSLLLMLFFIIPYLIWWKSEPLDIFAFGDTIDKVNRYNKTTSSTDSKIGKRMERGADFPRVDPFEMIEKFDTRFAELLIAEGNAWELGLVELANMVNRMGEQSDFQSVTVSALLVTRISDLAIARLMAAEVSPTDTLDGLERFTFSIPSDRRLIDFICELHPEGEEQRRENPPRSVDEFVSRFEEEAIFSDDEWSEKKTATGITSSGNATAKLLNIGGLNSNYMPLKSQQTICNAAEIPILPVRSWKRILVY
jgi:hypothetical protein